MRRLPAWLQQVLVYELTWYLIGGRAPHRHGVPRRRPRAGVPRAPRRRPAGAGPGRRRATTGSAASSRVWRDIFSHAGRPEPWRSPTAAVTRVDEAMRLERVTYRFTGTPPAETVSVRGQAFEPAWAKSQAHVYYGRPLIHTRILWLPAGAAVTLTLDGEPVRIRPARAEGRAHADGDEDSTGATGSGASRHDRAVPPGGSASRGSAGPRSCGGHDRSPSGSDTGMRGCSIDRANEADDNGERLFEHLRANRPDINAWFAISGDAPD